MIPNDILTEDQRRVLQLVAATEDIAGAFVLSGGTALAAFHLQHRISDDLDFFSEHPVDLLRIERFVDTLRKQTGAPSVESHRIYDRRIYLLPLPSGPLKVEFTLYPYTPLEPPTMHKGVRIESFRDIRADKLAALLDRFEPKDYYDFFAIAEHAPFDLENASEDVLTKFHRKVDPIELGAACARSDRLPILPHLVRPVTAAEVQAFFRTLGKGLRDDVMEE